MRFLSVCSGIEAASVAWLPLGWQAVGLSEIDAFPCAVLAHHYPSVPNLGDLETFHEWTPPAFDVLVGGTPCQSFSVAGLRAGLADPRGNLTLGFLGVVERFRPRWFVWENVPGVFSSTSHAAPDPRPPFSALGVVDGDERVVFDEYDADESHAFACFLAGLQELGYGFAYRTLDAQHFGVPQRRRRVFVVGHSSGAWQRSAAVLFERESLRGNPAPSREARQGTPDDVAKGVRTGSGGIDREDMHTLVPDVSRPILTGSGGQRTTDLDSGVFVPEVANPLTARMYKGINTTTDEGQTAIAEAFKPSHYTRDKDGAPSDIHPPLSADADKGDQDPVVFESRFARNDRGAPEPVCPPLKAQSGSTGRGDGAPLVFDETQVTSGENRSRPEPGDPSHTVPAAGRPPTVAFSVFPEAGQGADLRAIETDTGHALGVSRNERGTRLVDTRVRRLTPLECERLQGFPDHYTNIEGASDSARYRALGNSMAVPVMTWIGRRLQRVEKIK